MSMVVICKSLLNLTEALYGRYLSLNLNMSSSDFLRVYT